MWARWVMQTSQHESELNLNPERIETLIQEAQNSLEKVNSIELVMPKQKRHRVQQTSQSNVPRHN